MPTTPFAPLGRGITPRPQALSVDLYSLLIEMLLGPDCEPGATLNIDRLAEAWDVSPTPVRETLSQATTNGLVIRRQNYGFRVAPLLSPEDYSALMDARDLIQPYCAQRAATLATEAELDSFDRFQDAMERTPRDPTDSEYRVHFRADIGLHRGIVLAAHNRFVVQAFDNCNVHFFRFQRFRVGPVQDASDAHTEQRAIIAALRNRDPLAARKAMVDHVDAVRSRG